MSADFPGLCARRQDDRLFFGGLVCDTCGWARRHHAPVVEPEHNWTPKHDGVLRPPDATVVSVSRTNTAHVLDPDGHWLCNLFREDGAISAFDLVAEMTAAREHAPLEFGRIATEYAWGAWPCQTCCSRLRDVARSATLDL